MLLMLAGERDFYFRPLSFFFFLLSAFIVLTLKDRKH